ncbi:MAG: hypothetical protein WC621_00800 [Patescibacteria group bacterium]
MITTPITADDKVYAALSYLFVLAIVPLLFKRQREFVQWHARQGFLLFLAEIIIMIVSPIPVLGWLVAFVGWLAAVVLTLLGLASALTGRYWVMPYLGEYAKKLKI